MSNTLQLNKPYVNVGLDTMTYTVATAGNYNVNVQANVPSAVASGGGSGTARDLGLGQLGGYEGIGSVPATSLGQGGTGLGCLGSNTDGSAAAVSYSAVTSGLSIVVNQNGSPIYTSTAPTVSQSALQFKVSFTASATDVITVVLSSSNANDEQLNTVKSTVSIGQGF
jgi:hypothetical protein